MEAFNKFFISESATFLKKHIPNESIDLTITSPPYDDLRKYCGFIFDYKFMFNELYRVTKDGGIVVWVVGDKTEKGSETLTSFRHALYAKEIGFNVHDTMIYAKKNVAMYDSRNRRYKQAFEYMFIFSKGKPKTYNPIKDKPVKSKTLSKEHGRTFKGNIREKTGVIIANEFQDRFNIWEYNTGAPIAKDRIAFKHPAIFPEQLALDHILSWSNEGEVVMDCMCGSGTVPKMAYLNKRNFIGVDMSEEYINDICIPRLKKYGWKM